MDIKQELIKIAKIIVSYKSKKALYNDLRDIISKNIAKGKLPASENALGNETYGDKSFIYFTWDSQEDREKRSLRYADILLARRMDRVGKPAKSVSPISREYVGMNNKIERIASRIVATTYPINLDADFWSSVYVSSFPNSLWRTEKINENEFKRKSDRFMVELEKAISRIAKVPVKIKWSIIRNHSVKGAVIFGDRAIDWIQIYFGSEKDEAGKVYVDGFYPMGQGKTMKEVAQQIVDTYADIR